MTSTNLPGQPVDIPAEVLNQMKVAEIKAELRSCNVHFPSKLLKQALLDLLATSLHLPIIPESEKTGGQTTQNNNKKKRLHCWKKDHPARKLLYFDFKEGNIPLDANEMGPAEIHCKCSETTEFEGIECDDAFIQRLKSLRSHIMKEEPLLKWNEQHPARQLMFDEIAAERIPLDGELMGTAEVWSNYAATAEFKMRGMKCGDTFKRRLAALRKLIKRDKNRSAHDKLEVAKAIKNHPPPSHNHRGEPQWNGSEAQQLLKDAIEEGKHLLEKPEQLRLAKPQFQAFGKDTFRWKIQQELKTKKCLHALKHDAEQKLRKNLKKMSTAD